MNDPAADDLTTILGRVRAGDAEATEALTRCVHEQLRRLAHALLHRERPDHTLQSTDLVDETWLRLLGTQASPTWENRRLFFGSAAKAMRDVLVDHARRRGRDKRGGGWQRQSWEVLGTAAAVASLDAGSLLDLHAALELLAQALPRAAQVVELRFFAGLTIEQAAEVLDLATGTVETDFKVARAWLRERLEDPTDGR